ncbi:MAG: cytochrome c [Acidobacteria bacterium]|nr:cytochrome c [Acidobacteriota bacterium]
MNRWLLAVAATAVVLFGIWFAVGRKAQSGVTPKSGSATIANASERKPEAVATAEAVKRGQEVFADHCSVCHSPDTEEVIVGPSLMGFFRKTPAALADGKPLPQTDAAVREMIQKGDANMPPLGGDLSEQQIADVIAYLHTL